MTFSVFSDEHYMNEALKEAKKALDEDEVPIGAIIVCKDRIIARAYNRTEKLQDVTAHAEIQAFTAASEFLGSKYLKDCTLFVTLEPCIMCAGASYWTQLSRVVYGAADNKRGYKTLTENPFHPRTFVSGGIKKEECAKLVIDYFQKKRKK
jgi:tRNA(adenine34) deaminase